MSEQTTEANRLIDEMLAAQSRLAVSHRDGKPLTEMRRDDEAKRDTARAKLLEMARP